MQRVLTLDGWRGVAILLVVVDHYANLLWGRENDPAWLQHLGFHGVALFFVLSGYLITSKLVEEHKAEGSISLRAFYIRRVFRIFPAAWMFLAVVALGRFMSHRPIGGLELSSCLLFFRNFISLPPGVFITNHFWSLAVEEQFYLVWPALLLLAAPRRAVWVASGIAVVVAGYRWMMWTALLHQDVSVWLRTQYWIDGLMVGCLAALLLPRVRPWLRRWMFWPLLAGFVFCVFRYWGLVPLHEDVIMALLLVTPEEGVPARLLSFPPLRYLGRVSYSVYIWQQFFLGFVRSNAERMWICLLIMFSIALLSYYCVERPLTDLGRKLAKGQGGHAPMQKVLVG